MNIQGATRLSPTTGALALFEIIAFAALPKETKPSITDWEFSSESLLDGKE
ncbi:MAG: hypothetical protein ABF379_06365 [Akkermansiaceae bacterium]